MSWLVEAIIGAFLNWITKYIGKQVDEKKIDDAAKKEIETQTKADTDELKKAETEQEREKATDDIARNSF